MKDLKIKGLKDRPSKKRIQLDLDLRIYKGVVSATQMRYCTLTKWVTRAIIEKLQKEEELLLK